jgi:hypothetical protein
VARQTAVKARAMAVKRKVREKQVNDMPEPAALEPIGGSDLLGQLDQELCGLPDKYRTAIVLCDLEGKSYKQAARRLGCPEGTLAARLTRGRAMLAKRLTRHSLAVTGGALAMVLAQSASAGVPAAVLSSTIQSTNLAPAGAAAATGAISRTVAALTEGVLKTMLLAKLKVTAAAFSFGILIVGSSAVLLSPQVGAQQQPGGQARVERAAAPQEDNLKNTLMTLDRALWDAYTNGDPTLAQKLYADDLVSYSRYGRYGKKDALDSIRRYRPSELKIRNVELLRINKTTAILTYVYDVKLMTPDGKLNSVRSNQLISHCWAQRDGGWVLVFFQDFEQPGPDAAIQWRDADLGFFPPAKALVGKSKEAPAVRDARRKGFVKQLGIAEIDASLKKLSASTDDKVEREALASIERAVKAMKDSATSLDKVYPVKDLVIPVEPKHGKK